MGEQINIYEILDNALKDISKRVAKLEVVNVDSVQLEPSNVHSLITTTKGDYRLTIILSADKRVLRAITENMKRGQSAEEEEIPIYTSEYFNILCGHVISIMNNKAHVSARFGIPRMIDGPYQEDVQAPPQNHQEYYYKSVYGPLVIETMYEKIDNKQSINAG